ncbi:MAG: glucose-6-phosphate isomerase [Deltaproteobacteria bacterium]|nr:glucose-6-phosphate isomerase [Deltaproteobacteria bacterium]
MGDGIRFRFDFSLVGESNLSSGEGISAANFRSAMEQVDRAVEILEAKQMRGQIGFPDLPFLVPEARAIARDAAALGKKFTHLLVLGIGGSALGTRAVHEAVGGAAARRGMTLSVADNVDPDVFFPLLAAHPMKKTVVVAISKSGGTAETNAQLSLAIAALKKAVGKRWKEHLILVTDPSRGIFRRMAESEGLRSYDVPPNVGGRFSVLSPVGLLPLSAAGVRIGRLLDGAAQMESVFRHTKGADNPVRFAAAVYAHYLYMVPKPVHVWFTYGAGLDRVAEWWQQLWGESLGKKRSCGGPVGQTPARALGVTDQHSQVQLYQEGPADKVFTFVRWMKGREKGIIPKAGFAPDMAMLGGRPLRDLFDAEFEGTIGALWEAGRPIVRMEIGARDEEHVGAFLHFWEWVTAIVGECAGIDPFDQPGVEEGKKIARALMGERGSEERRAEFDRRIAGIRRAEIRIGEDLPSRKGGR